MVDDYPSRVAEKIVVRLPDGMRDKLAEIAKGNGRSSNAEVVAALASWIEGRWDHGGTGPNEEVVARVADRLFQAIVKKLENR